MDETLVRIEGLTKRFGRTFALDCITTTVSQGRIIGVLGINGAGKSTLLRHISGLYLPDAGRCVTLGRLAGELTEAELRQIGVVHQETDLIPWMKAGPLLRYLETFYPSWDRSLESRLVERFAIDLSKRVAVMTPGDRQKLAIVAAVAFRPKLLLLDEPAAGLDPIARADLMEFLVEVIQESDRSIIVSSHILQDVEKVVDHVWILRGGRLLQDRPLDELQQLYFRVKIDAPPGQLPDSVPWGGCIVEQRTGDSMLLIIPAHVEEEVRRAAADRHWNLEMTRLALEQLFRLESEKRS